MSEANEVVRGRNRIQIITYCFGIDYIILVLGIPPNVPPNLTSFGNFTRRAFSTPFSLLRKHIRI